MKTELISRINLLILALPLISTAAPYSLTVPDGEYRLVAASRFQGVEPIFIGQPTPWQIDRYTPTGYQIYTVLGGAWIPQDPLFFAGEGSIIQPSGGEGTFLFQQRAQPKLPLNLQPGLNLVCCQSDIVASYEDIVGAPPTNGTLLYQFNAGQGRDPFHLGRPDYTIFAFMFGTWTPSTPVIAVTEAVFILHPQELINFQITANEGVSFEVTTPVNKQVTVEYSNSLAQGASWQTLTNFVGTGTTVQIQDQPADLQRFYRARMSE